MPTSHSIYRSRKRISVATKNERQRFTKANLLHSLEMKIATYEREHGFKSYNGWDQVQGKEIEIIVAYGEYNALNNLIQELYT